MCDIIPLSYNPIDIPKLTEVLARYQNLHHNQIIADFEDGIKTTTGSPHVVALNSGTSAIHLALKVLGVGRGDVVIVPTFTYVATVNPIRYLGAEPVFIDSELDTWNMDPALLQKAIEHLKGQRKKPKAIMVVHTYGMPSKMDEILRVSKEYDIPIIEDAAESFGSEYKTSKAGTIGTIGVYSFNNNKVITTYGGGALLTTNPELASRVRFLATQARENLPYYEHHEVGYNYAMNPLGAAAGISQLPDLKQNIIRRRRIFDEYRVQLDSVNIQVQPEQEGSNSNRWLSAFLFRDKTTQVRVSTGLKAVGIETRPLWKPMHLQPVFKTSPAYLNGVSEGLFNSGLCLPSGSNLSVADQDRVIDIIKGVLLK